MHANRWFAWATAVLTCGLIIAMAVIGERPLAAQAGAPPASRARPAAPPPRGGIPPSMPPPGRGAGRAAARGCDPAVDAPAGERRAAGWASAVAGPGGAGRGGRRLRRRGDMPGVPRPVVQGHEARARLQRSHARGDARLRELS